MGSEPLCLSVLSLWCEGMACQVLVWSQSTCVSYLLMDLKAKAVIFLAFAAPRPWSSKESQTKLDSGAKSQDDLVFHLSSVNLDLKHQGGNRGGRTKGNHQSWGSVAKAAHRLTPAAWSLTGGGASFMMGKHEFIFLSSPFSCMYICGMHVCIWMFLRVCGHTHVFMPSCGDLQLMSRIIESSSFDLYLNHWGRVSCSNPDLTDRVSLTSQLVLSLAPGLISLALCLRVDLCSWPSLENPLETVAKLPVSAVTREYVFLPLPLPPSLEAWHLRSFWGRDYPLEFHRGL